MKKNILKSRSVKLLFGIIIFPLIFTFLINISSVFATTVCLDADGNSKGGASVDGKCPPGSIPYTSNAGGGLQTQTIDSITVLLNRFIGIVNLFIPFLIGLAVFIIIYGIFSYISSAADEEKRKEARDFIVWGIVGIFVMLSVWGLINILNNTFNFDRSTGIVQTVYPQQPLPPTPPKTVPELIDRINIIGPYVIAFLIGIAVFVIILGIFNYVRQAENEEKRQEARSFVIWGVIFVFLMLSIWGMVNILVKTFNFDNSVPSLTNIFSHLKL